MRFEISEDGHNNIIDNATEEVPSLKEIVDTLNNQNQLIEELLAEQECECVKEPEDEEPILLYICNNRYKVPPVVVHVLDHLQEYRNSYLFVVFGLGSVKIDVDNPKNVLLFLDDFVEVFNDENGETTIIKNDEITGFVIEPKPVQLEDLVGDVDDSDDS